MFTLVNRMNVQDRTPYCELPAPTKLTVFPKTLLNTNKSPVSLPASLSERVFPLVGCILGKERGCRYSISLATLPSGKCALKVDVNTIPRASQEQAEAVLKALSKSSKYHITAAPEGGYNMYFKTAGIAQVRHFDFFLFDGCVVAENNGRNVYDATSSSSFEQGFVKHTLDFNIGMPCLA